MSARVAFLGLGHMGLPMAANLGAGGFDVVVFDLSPGAVADARGRGLAVAASGTDAAASADVVITMFPEGRHVLSAYRGTDDSPGLLAAARPGTLFMDCSTIAVDRSEEHTSELQSL